MKRSILYLIIFIFLYITLFPSESNYPKEVIVRYYHHDHLGNIVAVTDENGNLIEDGEHDFYPFGKETPPAKKDEFLFTGKPRDIETGLDYFGQRYYSNKLCRFLETDPFTLKKKSIQNPQGWNLYSYCLNNPINAIDPNGKDVVLLNSNTKRYGDSHTAVLVGNDLNGWKFFSRDGEVGSVFGGRDQNRYNEFNSLNDFKSSDLTKEFPNAFHIRTDSHQDIKMLKAATSLMSVEYSPSFNLNLDGSYQQMNCADYTFEVLKSSKLNVIKENSNSSVSKITGSFKTSPQKQYDYVLKNNNGTELKPREDEEEKEK